MAELTDAGGEPPPFELGGFASTAGRRAHVDRARAGAARSCHTGELVRGFVYDVDTGLLTEVTPES